MVSQPGVVFWLLWELNVTVAEAGVLLPVSLGSFSYSLIRHTPLDTVWGSARGAGSAARFSTTPAGQVLQ